MTSPKKPEKIEGKNLEEILEAIWIMCRKNESYSLDMFKNDLIPKIKAHTISQLPSEEEIRDIVREELIACNDIFLKPSMEDKRNIETSSNFMQISENAMDECGISSIDCVSRSVFVDMYLIDVRAFYVLCVRHRMRQLRTWQLIGKLILFIDTIKLVLFKN